MKKILTLTIIIMRNNYLMKLSSALIHKSISRMAITKTKIHKHNK